MGCEKYKVLNVILKVYVVKICLILPASFRNRYRSFPARHAMEMFSVSDVWYLFLCGYVSCNLIYRI